MRIIAPNRQPKTQAIGRGLSRLDEDIEYVFEEDGTTYKLKIQAGFNFDGASIPRLLWTPLGLTPHGDMDGPTLPHDLVYHFAGKLPRGSFCIVFAGGDVVCDDVFPRAMADRLLMALCLHFCVTGKVKAWLVRAGVFAFGWASWRRDDVERKNTLLPGAA